MASFLSDGVSIAYDDLGDGRPVVLVHGFASQRRRNWEEPRWYEALRGAGWRVVALDCRGHGESDKPHDASAYAIEHVAGDVLRLLDHLSIERAALMGYSMGARISAALLSRHGDRFTAAVLGGVGKGMIGERRGAETIARALEADDAASVTDAGALAFRAFAEAGRNDLRALAACMRGLRSTVDAADLARIATPVLVVVGDRDTLVGDPQPLVDAIPGARLVIVPGRDHLSTVGDKRYKQAALEFLR